MLIFQLKSIPVNHFLGKHSAYPIKHYQSEISFTEIDNELKSIIEAIDSNSKPLYILFYLDKSKYDKTKKSTNCTCKNEDGIFCEQCSKDCWNEITVVLTNSSDELNLLTSCNEQFNRISKTIGSEQLKEYSAIRQMLPFNSEYDTAFYDLIRYLGRHVPPNDQNTYPNFNQFTQLIRECHTEHNVYTIMNKNNNHEYSPDMTWEQVIKVVCIFLAIVLTCGVYWYFFKKRDIRSTTTILVNQ